MESYLSTSKNQYASSVINKKEDTRYAEPDPSLRPFFQFLLNSKKRKKRNLRRSPDSRIVEDFINYSINSLRNPIRADSFDSVVLLHNNGVQHLSYAPESDTQYMPVPIYTKISKPKPVEYDMSSSTSISGSIYPTSTSDPYKNWQETPLIFPDSNKKLSTTRPPLSSNHYRPEYNIPALVNNQSPTFVTPIQLQAPTFVTPIEYQGPTFVTPISVTQTPSSNSNAPPTIVILEDIDTVVEPPQSDPIVEQDPVGAGGGSGAGGGGAAAAAGAAAAGVASVVGAGAGIAGIAGGVAASITGGSAGGAGGGGSGGGTLTPADVAQCRAGGGASKVCSELITTSSSSDGSDSISFLDSITSMFSSFNFIGPLMITFWSMIFPPMSIILTSGLGVISFLFPWILPRLWFGRQLTNSFNISQFDQRLESTNSYYHQPYY